MDEVAEILVDMSSQPKRKSLESNSSDVQAKKQRYPSENSLTQQVGKVEVTLQKEAADYEKQRVLGIAQSKAQTETVGLPKIANAGGMTKQNRVVKNDKEDVDYEPKSDDDDDNDDNDSDHDHESQKELETTGPRDDDVNHELHDSNMDEQEPTLQSKKKTGRGPSKPVQSSVPMILDFDDLNLPMGPWEKAYGQQIGLCAWRIDINIRKWAKVDQVKKDTLWAETKKLFHIDDPQGIRKKNFLRALGARFRHHKSWLVSRFIEKKNAPNDKKPWETYGCYITQDQWDTFVAYVTSEEFKKKSLIAKECSKGNIHRHTLGQKSYSRKRADWVKEKRLPPPSESSIAESSVVTERVQNRALEWCLAHQRRTWDGKWEVDPNKVETVRVVRQVMEHLEKEAKEKEDGAASSSEPDFDALSKALGKKDYYGYVKGIGRSGVGVGHRKAFGKVYRKDNTSRDEEIKALKATITRLETKFEAHMASLSSLSMARNKEVNSSPPQQQPIIEAPQKCRLAVKDDDGNLVVVADGTSHPCDVGVIHTSSQLPDHYRVSIDNLYEEHSLVDLPVPAPDGETKLGKAKDYFVNWPMSMVLFEDTNNAMKAASQSKEQVGSCDPLRTQESGARLDEHTPVAGVELLKLPECDLLHLLMVEDKHDIIRVPLKAPLLYLREDKDVWVTSTDIVELISGACVNVSMIHVYILYLVEEFISAFQGEYITFLCPQRISGAECKRNFPEVVAYVKHAFTSELQKKESHCRFILAPYNEDNHWILMAIDLRAGILFQLDPLAQQQPRQLSCEKVFDIAYKSYRARIKGNSNLILDVKQIECAQQTGGTQCGYYVMKYMYEIVTRYSEWGDLQKEYTVRSDSYSTKELDEVREQWARFFRHNFLLS